MKYLTNIPYNFQLDIFFTKIYNSGYNLVRNEKNIIAQLQFNNWIDVTGDEGASLADICMKAIFIIIGFYNRPSLQHLGVT